MTAGLDIRGLRVKYGDTVGLDGVDVAVAPGEAVALVGANGAGKSTLLNTVLGLVPVAAGTIAFGGRRVERSSTRERIAGGIALSPEGRQVFPMLSVRENLELGDLGADRNAREARIEEAYAMFPRLAERRRQPAGTLSGGEQQMLAIGRALMAQPRLLMLDEPTLGLAPIVVREIERIIDRIRRQGISVLLAEQNASMALGIADRAYVLQNGHVVLAGAAAQVMADREVRSAYLGL